MNTALTEKELGEIAERRREVGDKANLLHRPIWLLYRDSGLLLAHIEYLNGRISDLHLGAEVDG